MRNQRMIFVVLALALAALACNLPAQGGSPAVPAATVEPTLAQPEPQKATEKPAEKATAAPVVPTKAPSVATVTPTGLLKFDFNGLGFSYPADLFAKPSGKIAPVELNDAQSSGWMGPVPEHYEVDITGYPLKVTSHAPQIILYPAKTFGAVNTAAADTSKALDNLLRANSVGAGPIPFMPMWNAAQVFNARANILPFQNGRGVRFLSCYAQAVLPIANECLFYTFQGLTADGKYYLSVIFPVNLAALDSAENKDRFAKAQTDEKTYQIYLEEMAKLLVSSKADDFQPNLTVLDEVVKSLVAAPTVEMKAPLIPAVDCSGALTTHLKNGLPIRVTFTDGTPLRLRKAPSKSGAVLGTIPEGGAMTVTGGPQCTGNGLWWQVHVASSGLDGWVLEGEKGVYFIEPMP